jgi:hypothetical protein
MSAVEHKHPVSLNVASLLLQKAQAQRMPFPRPFARCRCPFRLALPPARLLLHLSSCFNSLRCHLVDFFSFHFAPLP